MLACGAMNPVRTEEQQCVKICGVLDCAFGATLVRKEAAGESLNQDFNSDLSYFNLFFPFANS